MQRLVLLFLAGVAAVPLFAASAALPETNAALAGAAYIKSIQTTSGTYGTDSPGQNMDAVFAVRAAGYDPSKDLVSGKGPAEFLIANVGGVNSAAAAAKAALGAKALGIDPKSVGGADLVARITTGLDDADASYLGDDFSQSVALLGLACTGNEVPAAAVDALKGSAISDGGGWGFGGFADPDTTAIAIQALLASGVAADDPVVVAALAFLKSMQGEDGGWGFDPTESNTSSTAYVVQALIALGEDPDSAVYTANGIGPTSYLLSQQQADGSFAGFDPAYATNQVVPALAGRTFCNAVDTPITRTRPVVVPPSPIPPTPTATAAPKPPSTGSGDTRPVDRRGSYALAMAGVLFAISALATFSQRRER